MSNVPRKPARLDRDGAALALCFAIAALPALAVTLPPIMDFPNHLARIWLIAGGASQPPLSEIYRIDFAKAAGNFGVDFLAATAARGAPIFVVSKVLVLLATLGPPLGAALLNRALVGRAHPFQLAGLTLAWSTTAIAGFVNFQISLAGALFGAAFVATRLERAAPGRVVVHLAVSTILLLVHPLGLGFYVAAVFGLLIGPQFPTRITRAEAVRFVRRFAELLVAAAAPVVVKSLVLGGVAGAAPRPFWGDVANIVDPVHILTILLSPFLSYDLRADLPAALLIVGLVAFALVGRHASLHAGLALVAGILFVLSPLSPDAFGDGSWLTHRFPIMAALLFVAALRPQAQSEVARRRFRLAFAALALGRTLWIGSVWMSRQGDIDSLLAATRAIPPGASVVTLQQEFADWRQAPIGRFMIGSPNGVRATGRHLGGLVVIERHAFIPTLFSVPGQHPLAIAPGWSGKSVIASSIPYPRQLGARVASDPYLENWRANFDYVLLLNADLPALSDFDAATLSGLVPVADRGFARLYKVIAP